MNISKIKSRLITMLYDACIDYSIEISNNIKNENIYAFTIHCVSGCEGVSVAISTRESIENLPSTKNPEHTYDKYNYVNVAEWVHLGLHEELFLSVSKFMQKISSDLYDSEFEDVDLDALNEGELQKFYDTFFIDAIVIVINNLKESGCLDKSYFEKDLLLGVQFSDPGVHDRYMIEEVSAQVNSESWHAKVKEFCNSFAT